MYFFGLNRFKLMFKMMCFSFASFLSKLICFYYVFCLFTFTTVNLLSMDKDMVMNISNAKITRKRSNYFGPIIFVLLIMSIYIASSKLNSENKMHYTQQSQNLEFNARCKNNDSRNKVTFSIKFWTYCTSIDTFTRCFLLIVLILLLCPVIDGCVAVVLIIFGFLAIKLSN